MINIMKKLKEFLGLTYYTSKLDEFLAEYDSKHRKLSISQRKEIDKYTRIHALRDNPIESKSNDQIWDKF